MASLLIILLYVALVAVALAMVYRGMVFKGLTIVTVLAISITFLLDSFQQEMSYPGKKVIVLAAMWASGENKQEFLDKCAAEFEREHPEYKVIIRYDGRWVLSKNRARLLTGKDIPDIIEGDNNELRILVTENYVMPLDRVMDQPSASTHKPWREDWLPAMLDMGRYAPNPLPSNPNQPHPLNGKICQVPGIYYNMLWFYNKALMKKLGTSLPQTWDEFFAVCQKAREAGIEPVMLDNGYEDLLIRMMMMASMPDDAAMHSVRGDPGARPFTDPIYTRIFQAERTLADKYLMKGWQACQWPKAQQEFATGRGLFVFCGSWLPGELREVAVQDKAVYDLGVMPMMRFDDEAPGTFAIISSGWMVIKDGKETEGAIKFLQYLTDRWGRDIVLKDGNPVAFVRDPLPTEQQEIAEKIKNIKRIVPDSIPGFAPRWLQYIFLPLHKQFMEAEPGAADYMTAEQFGVELQRQTELYQKAGGEAKWD